MEPTPWSSRKTITAQGYLDVVALEEVEVRFVLARLLADESEDGVEAAGTADGLAVLDGSHGEVFQLLLVESGGHHYCLHVCV